MMYIGILAYHVKNPDYLNTFIQHTMSTTDYSTASDDTVRSITIGSITVPISDVPQQPLPVVSPTSVLQGAAPSVASEDEPVPLAMGELPTVLALPSIHSPPPRPTTRRGSSSGGAVPPRRRGLSHSPYLRRGRGGSSQTRPSYMGHLGSRLSALANRQEQDILEVHTMLGAAQAERAQLWQQCDLTYWALQDEALAASEARSYTDGVVHWLYDELLAQQSHGYNMEQHYHDLHARMRIQSEISITQQHLGEVRDARHEAEVTLLRQQLLQALQLLGETRQAVMELQAREQARETGSSI
jgi:hypothetical protein